jgi:hypothetical protein
LDQVCNSIAAHARRNTQVSLISQPSGASWGSEWAVRQRRHKLLTGEQAQLPPRHSNDNAQAESRTGTIMRRPEQLSEQVYKRMVTRR